MKNLSEILGVNEKLLWFAYSLARTDRGYESFEIPKRNGGTRKIHKPVQILFRIQQLIKINILDQAPEPASYVTAFRKGLSITNNAEVHCNKALLVKFDLKDFFPTISFTRIVGIFLGFGFDKNDAKRLAYLTTIKLDAFNESPSTQLYFERLRREKITRNYASHLRDEARDKKIAMNYGIDFDDLDFEARVLFEKAKEIEDEGSRKQLKRRGLPQGAPTSPQLANLASMRLDARLNGLAKFLGFQYTRYADDLTFSSDKSKCKSDVLANLVKKIVEECRFELNTNKTCFMRAPATRQTTGLIVNEERPKVRRSVIRLVRAMIHRRNLGIITNEQIERLNGYLSFIGMVNPGQVEKLLTKAK